MIPQPEEGGATRRDLYGSLRSLFDYREWKLPERMGGIHLL